METQFNLALILQEHPLLVLFIVFLTIWSLTWKAFALWRAVKNESVVWFIALLIVNTAGILEILYLFVFGKKHTTPPPKHDETDTTSYQNTNQS